jgi:hypothetical protein
MNVSGIYGSIQKQLSLPVIGTINGRPVDEGT